jgi:hypothetical protein
LRWRRGTNRVPQFRSDRLERRLIPPDATRYAVYLAPEAGSAFWRFGSRVLGHDAETGEDVHGFHPRSMTEAAWRAATARARLYGFHATLKAPFRLAPGADEAGLLAALVDLAKGLPPINTLPVDVAVLDGTSEGGFVALVPDLPDQPDQRLATLESTVVRSLDAFRARLTESEIARRKPGGLTARQNSQLMEYGYPFIFSDYQPHFTLSDRLANSGIVADDLRQELRIALDGAAGSGIAGQPCMHLNDLALFRQNSAGENFRIIARARMCGGAVAAAAAASEGHGND